MAMQDIPNTVLALTAIGSLGLNAAMFWSTRHQTKAWREFAAAQNRIAESYEKEVKAIRREMTATRKAAGTRQRTEEQKLALEQQRIAQRERKLELEKAKMAGKAIGWLVGQQK